MDTKPQIPPRSTRWMIVHLFTLCALGIAKSIYDILAAQPDYLIVNRLSDSDIYIFMVIISIGFPALLSVPLILPLGKIIHTAFQGFYVTALVTFFSLNLLKGLDILPPMPTVIIALLLGGGSGVQYFRNHQFYVGLKVLSPLIIIFPLLFLFSTSIQRVLQPVGSAIPAAATSLERTPPIVMVVFDEFSSIDLLNAQGEIDAKRFPNFAQLATESTWYSNATAMDSSTIRSLPKILSGLIVGPDALPRREDYPQNVFSILKPFYSFHVIEPVTSLFPKRFKAQQLSLAERTQRLYVFCEDMIIVYLYKILPTAYTSGLPSIKAKWGGFNQKGLRKVKRHKRIVDGRKNEITSFINTLDEYPENTFHFLHTHLPHRPGYYLPSTKQYTRISKTLMGEESVAMGKPLESQVGRYHQRHLLQIGFVDTMLGQLMDQMKSMGIYNDSLLIVLADHGVSYQREAPNRSLTAKNYAEIASIPLFIKQPGQYEGLLDTSNAETIDVLPTITDSIGAQLSWSLDGRSLIDSEASARLTKVLSDILSGEEKVLEYSEEHYLRERDRILARTVKRFSLDDPRATLFHYGEALEYVGRPTQSLTQARIACAIECSSLDKLRNVDLDAPSIPTRLIGTIEGISSKDQSEALLVASVNGVVQGVVRPFKFRDENNFDMILSDEIFVQGENDVDLFVIRAPKKVDQP